MPVLHIHTVTDPAGKILSKCLGAQTILGYILVKQTFWVNKFMSEVIDHHKQSTSYEVPPYWLLNYIR